MRNKKLFLFLIALFFFYLNLHMVTPVISIYLTDLGASIFGAGFSTALFGAAILCCRLPFFLYHRRLPRRLLMFSGIAVAIIAPLVFVFIRNASFAIVVRGLQGLSVALFTAVFVPQLTDWVPSHQRGKWLGLQYSISGLAIALAPALAGWFVAKDEVKTCFLLAIVFGVISFAMTATLPWHEKTSESTSTDAVFRPWWKRYHVLLACVTVLSCGPALAAVMTYIPLHLKLLDQPLLISAFFPILSVSAIAARAITGPFGDRHAPEKLLPYFLFMQMVSLWIVASGDETPWLLAGAFLFGISYGGLQPLATKMLADATQPVERNGAYTFLYSFYDGGIFVGMLVVSFISEVLSIPSGIFVSSLFAAPAFLLMLQHAKK